jgi:tRNA(Ile)-lysidine synthase
MLGVLESVRAGGLLDGGPIVVLCSGGQDSICLLDVAVRLRGPDAVRALHVNYGLRGKDSEADERLVTELCSALGVALEVVRAARPADASGNVQAWARDVRYGAAARAAAADRALIASGHTATDQAEGIVYRLAASPGRRALLGMAARDGSLVRPLLGVTRQQTGAYCQERGLSWREDRSNEDPGFARARVRTRVMPALRELHPAAEQNVLRSAALLRDEAVVLEEVVRTALSGRERISIERLAALPVALRRLVVVRLAEDAAGRLVPEAGDRVDELLRLAPRGGSAQLDVGGGVSAIVEYGVLRFESTAAQAAPVEVRLPLPGSVRFGAWRLAGEVGELGDALGRLRDDGSVGVLDLAALRGAPLTVRAWRAGDRLQPLGMAGSKTLADLFCDRRVPRAERGALPVVVCEETIAWVPGVATAERFRLSERTLAVAVVSAERVAD